MGLNIETILKVVDFIIGLIRGLMEKGLVDGSYLIKKTKRHGL